MIRVGDLAQPLAEPARATDLLRRTRAKSGREAFFAPTALRSTKLLWPRIGRAGWKAVGMAHALPPTPDKEMGPSSMSTNPMTRFMRQSNVRWSYIGAKVQLFAVFLFSRSFVRSLSVQVGPAAMQRMR